MACSPTKRRNCSGRLIFGKLHDSRSTRSKLMKSLQDHATLDHIISTPISRQADVVFRLDHGHDSGPGQFLLSMDHTYTRRLTNGASGASWHTVFLDWQRFLFWISSLQLSSVLSHGQTSSWKISWSNLVSRAHCLRWLQADVPLQVWSGQLASRVMRQPPISQACSSFVSSWARRKPLSHPDFHS